MDASLKIVLSVLAILAILFLLIWGSGGDPQ